MKRLDIDEQELLRLRFEERLTTREIGERFGCTKRPIEDRLRKLGFNGYMAGAKIKCKITTEGRDCNLCGKFKSWDNFAKRKNRQISYASYCKECMQGKHQPVNWISQIKTTYKVTAQQYMEMLDQQNGGCAICGKTPEKNKKRLGIDHDHMCCPGYKSCGLCIRQLLCDSCNTGISRFRDNPLLLDKAASYIRDWKTKEKYELAA